MSNTSLARILIVDDEEAQLKALCETLRSNGYETVGCLKGSDALAELEKTEFDLLLADLMMPGIDGIALLQTAISRNANLVGIIMTGEGTITTAVAAMKSGALDYILKPFKLSQIVPVLSRALSVRRLRMEKMELESHLKERTAQLESANHELEAFSYSVSHDLRAPLRAINGFSSILAQDHSSELSGEAQSLLNDVIANTQRMAQLIEDLLRFSRLGTQPLSIQPVNISAMVEEVVQAVRTDEGERQVEVQIGELPNAMGDPPLLRQVFVNLISNAFKFSRQKTPAVIEVWCLEQDSGNVYCVRDNGAGFDMRYADNLFGVFQRLHSGEQFEGTGIGLSIVQRIIQRHGGRIWAVAEAGQGAAFYFTLGALRLPDSK